MLALIPPAIVAFLESGWGIALVVVIGYYVFHLVGEYIVRPRFMKKGFDMSILTLTLSLIFWTWVLGPAGAVLAVPLTLAVTNVVARICLGTRPPAATRAEGITPWFLERVETLRGINLFFQLQHGFTRAARNPLSCKPQPPEDVEHPLILGEDICPDFLKAPFPGYPDEHLYEFGPKAFPLEPILHENGQFAGRQVRVHNKSCNPYHLFLPVFLASPQLLPCAGRSRYYRKG